MKINQSAYPNAEKLPSGAGYSSTYYDTYDIKSPVYETQTFSGTDYKYRTLWSAANTGAMQKNTDIDMSACYCGIPPEADIANWRWCLREGSGGDYSLNTPDCTTGAAPVIMALANYADYPQHRWGFAQNDDYEGGWCIAPITDYRWCDFVILPVLWASATETGSTNSFTLSEYDETAKTNYPYVREIQLRLYLGSGDIPRVRVDNSYGNNIPSRYTTSNSNFSGVFRFVRLQHIINPPGWTNEYNNYYGTGIQYDTRCCIYNLIGREDISVITSVGSGSPYITGNTFAGGDNWEIRPTNSSYTTASTYYVGDEDIIEYAKKQAAYIGLPFADNLSSVTNTVIDDSMTDEHMYLPLFDDNGYTTGEYKSGVAAAALPQATWGSNWQEGNKWDGSEFETFDLQTVLNTNPLVGNNIFVHSYHLSEFTASALATYLYNTLAPNVSSDDLLQSFLTNDPIKCIVNCIMYPFDFVYNEGYRNIIMGNVDTGVSTNTVTDLIQIIDMGSLKYVDKFKNFLSYEPYCTALLYIPYHGYTDILPSQYVGHTISVKCIVDLQTGSSIALVYRDGLVIKSITGQIGTSVQLTGVDSATYNAAMFNAINGYKQAKTAATVTGGTAILSILAGAASMTAGIATANPVLAMGGFAGAIGAGGKMANLSTQVERAEYQLNHVQIPFDITGTSSPMTSLRNEQKCRLIITRPKMLPNFDADKYGNTVGYACCQTGKISDFTGYTEITSADLSTIPCTASEKSEIMKLLQNGVYL